MGRAVVQENVPEEDSIFPVKMSWQKIVKALYVALGSFSTGPRAFIVLLSSS